MHTQVDIAREYPLSMGPLTSLNWSQRFLEQTPGDDVSDGPSRQVPGACWSKVTPFAAPNPTIHLWSENIAETLGLSPVSYTHLTLPTKA